MMFGFNNIANINTTIFNNTTFVSTEISSLLTRIISGNRYSVLFDGRLYNKNEIKEDLLRQGHVFFTDTDAELLLLCY